MSNLPVVINRQAEGNESQYLRFQLGGETYAIGILHIKEILEYGEVTEVPMMPEFIQGVINLRGRVVPVINLQARFGKHSSALSKRTCIVIIEIGVDSEYHDIGIVVDSVSEVIDIPGSDIEPPPSFGSKIRSEFIHGMGKVNGKFVIILNVDKVLSLDDVNLISNMAS